MLDMVRLNSAGPPVTDLQRLLIRAGYHVAADGYFGHSTEAAVRLFQRRHALLPDGIAGPRTLRTLGQPSSIAPSVGGPTLSALTQQVPIITVWDLPGALADLVMRVGPAVLPWTITALHELPVPNLSRPPRTMRMSDVAIIFLYSLEAEKNVSNHLYWPTGASGVTLGAGYDMRDRDAATIKADMLSIGLSPQAAQTASEGSGRIGLLDAFVFAQKNHSAIALTPDQETSLLRLILPHYERIVQEHVIVNLLQHEFDALVSFAYNPGGKFRACQ
jgi:hypothetical protein